MSEQQEGRKYDAAKSRLDLVEPSWLTEVGHVLGHGATKYGVRNWKHVEPHRYHAAAMRHLLAIMAGEVYDPETGLSHAAHLACSAMFLHWQATSSTINPVGCTCEVCYAITL